MSETQRQPFLAFKFRWVSCLNPTYSTNPVSVGCLCCAAFFIYFMSSTCYSFAMWESVKFFINSFIKKAWIGILLVFLDLFDLFDRFFKPLLPPGWRDINVPGIWNLLFVLILFWAAFSTYHDLRKKKMEEFLDYAPEFKRDRIFRIFYKLYREGEFLKNANTERRQKWDEEILVQITTNCTPAFRMNYLLATKRRPFRVNDMKDVEPLQDKDFDAALSEIKQYLDNHFNIYTI